MSGRVSIVGNLTNLRIGTLLLLTLLLFTSHHLHSSYAGTTNTISAEDNARLNNAKNYLRDQALRNLPPIPQNLRDDFAWLSNGWHPLADTENTPNNAAPVVDLNHRPDTPTALSMPFDLTMQYHHKGFLPTQDALTIQGTVEKSLADKKIRLGLQPFYGQSWHSTNHYWGSEATLDLAQRPDDLPWGHLTLGYVSGKDNLTDHGTGLDLHGDLDLTRGWTFTSGVRQETTSGDSTYVALKWRLGL